MFLGELAELRLLTEKMKHQLSESQQKEKFLVRRVAVKEQESQDLVVSTNKDFSNVLNFVLPYERVFRAFAFAILNLRLCVLKSLWSSGVD